jgi:hypothetical protein
MMLISGKTSSPDLKSRTLFVTLVTRQPREEVLLAVLSFFGWAETSDRFILRLLRPEPNRAAIGRRRVGLSWMTR